MKKEKEDFTTEDTESTEEERDGEFRGMVRVWYGF